MINEKEPIEQQINSLFWAIANYEADEPYENGDHVYTPYSLQTLKQYINEPHCGDCTDVPMTCMRCFTEHCWHKAQSIASMLQTCHGRQ